MISYRPFWETLGRSPESTYTLIKNHRISSSTIDKLRKNKPLLRVGDLRQFTAITYFELINSHITIYNF